MSALRTAPPAAAPRAKHFLVFDGNGSLQRQDYTWGALLYRGLGSGFDMEVELVGQEHGPATGCKTNNEAEYYALIHGLYMAREKGIRELYVVGDSKLVVEQVQGNWKVKAKNLLPYLEHVEFLVREEFDKVLFTHKSRDHWMCAACDKMQRTKEPKS